MKLPYDRQDEVLDSWPEDRRGSADGRPQNQTGAPTREPGDPSGAGDHPVEQVPAETRRSHVAEAGDRRRSARRRSPLLPLLAGLAALALGLILTFTSPTKYTASTNLAIVPGTANPTQAASLFDTLSKGQIVATASSIYSEPHWVDAYPGVTLTAGGVTPSAVMTISGTGSDPNQVSRALQDAVSHATPTVNRALSPYKVMRLSSAETLPGASPTGIGRSTMIALSALLGVVVAAVTAAILSALGRRGR